MKKLFALVASLTVMAFAVPLYAADAPGPSVQMGGRIRFDLAYNVREDELNKSGETLVDMYASLNTNSYLRTLFTSADKTTGMHLEIGLGSYQIANTGSAGLGSESVSLRYAYGWWKVGNCKLTVGHSDGWLGSAAFSPSWQHMGTTYGGKSLMHGFGLTGAARNPRVAFEWDNGMIGAQIALGQAGAEYRRLTSNNSNGFWDTSSMDSYSNWPRVELVFSLKYAGLHFTPGVGISQYDYEVANNSPNQNLDDVLSYILWIPVKYTNGPFTIKAQGFYGKNTDTDWSGQNNTDGSGTIQSGNLSQRHFRGQPYAIPYVKNNGENEDTDIWGVNVTADYKIGKLTLSAGAGMSKLNNDAWGENGGEDEYTRWGAYVAAPYAVTSNFTVGPELSYWDYGDRAASRDGNDAGNEWLIGLFFQFLF